MPTSKLPNYLKSRRRRNGFSQRELAYLLGCKTYRNVTRYERFRRSPNINTAFALEVIFDEPASVLVAGLFQQARKRVRKRARLLLKKIEVQNKTAKNHEQKLATLRRIISGQ